MRNDLLFPDLIIAPTFRLFCSVSIYHWIRRSILLHIIIIFLRPNLDVFLCTDDRMLHAGPLSAVMNDGG